MGLETTILGALESGLSRVILGNWAGGPDLSLLIPGGSTQTYKNTSSMSNPALMSVTYHLVNSRPVVTAKQQQGAEMQKRIAGTVKQVNTTTITRDIPSPVISGVGSQTTIRSANVSGKLQPVLQQFAPRR